MEDLSQAVTSFLIPLERKMLTVTRTMMKLRKRRMKQTDLQNTPSIRRCFFSSLLSTLFKREYLWLWWLGNCCW